MASSAGGSSHQNQQNPHSGLPKYMPPVTLDSVTPHPYLPLQPDKSQFIIQPKEPYCLPQSVNKTNQEPKNILTAAKGGQLEWVSRYSEAGQTELADSMGEVIWNTFFV